MFLTFKKLHKIRSYLSIILLNYFEGVLRMNNKGFLLMLAICTSICIGILTILMYNFVVILINGF